MGFGLSGERVEKRLRFSRVPRGGRTMGAEERDAAAQKQSDLSGKCYKLSGEYY